MVYGRKPKYRESDYSMFMKTCMMIEDKYGQRENTYKHCLESYKKTSVTSRRKSRRYPIKMKMPMRK